ncbi:MAG: glycosyltransferase family 9 protein [Elusimicrobia bacterium]|nr:glycosyltransferase family 9 protein [Candidatus Obscuribacterium magneticum]
MIRQLDFLVGVPLVNTLGLLTRKGRPIPQGIKKLLLIKFAAMGDTILLVPVLRQLRKALPRVQIHWLVSSINQSIAQTVPYVDKIYAWEGGLNFTLVKLIAALRREKYDLVIDGEQWSRGSPLMAYLTGSKIRIGFDTPCQYRASLFTHTLKKQYRHHEIYDFYDLVEKFISLPLDTNLELWETEEGQSELNRIWKKPPENTKKILIHPGCGRDGFPREWPLVNYGVIGHWLKKKYDAHLILSSGPEERQKTAHLSRLLNGLATDLGGQLSWPGMVSLVKEMDLIISGNTGVMHIAAAFKKPQIALHGPTNSLLWGPLNLKAIVLKSKCPHCPCLRLGFEYHKKDRTCMKLIDIDGVKSAVSSLFDNSSHI